MTTHITSARTELMREHYALIDAADVTGLIDLYADDVAYHRPGYEPITGSAALDHFYRFDRVIREGRHVVETVVAEGDDVAVHGSFTGSLHDGTPIAHRFAEFFVIDQGGRIARRDTFFFTQLV
jgi:steroid delta-isomerase